MAFNDVSKRIKYPSKTSERFKRLDALDRLRAGTFYDHIKVSFDQGESEEPGSYVKLRDRRPSIIWNGAKMLVDQLSGLLWGDEQSPIVRTYYGEEPSDTDKAAEQGIQHVVEVLDLDAVMDDITDKASSGSAAVIVRSIDGEPYIEVVAGKECKPRFDLANPTKLVALEHLYPTTGQILADMGYVITDENLGKNYWFRLVIDKTDETWYVPLPDDEYDRLGEKREDGSTIAWVIDTERSEPHEWPVLPVLWAKAPRGNRIDGECLYAPIVDMLVAIDYGLSQNERGMRYTADPMLAVTGGELGAGAVPTSYTPRSRQAAGKKAVVKSPQSVLQVDPGGKAEYLEISADGLTAYAELIKMFREWGLEICGGMKSDASTTKGVESGRALEMLYQSLILVVKRWRIALGNKVFLPLIVLILSGIAKGLIEVDGLEGEIDPESTMRLVWPSWMTPQGQDLAATANAWQTLAGGSPKDPVPILPRATVTRLAAGNLGFTDPSTIAAELESQVEDDKKEADAQAQAQQAHELAVKTAAGPDNGPPTNNAA